MGKREASHVESRDVNACYTVEDVANLLRTSRNRVYDLVYAGKMKAISLLTDTEMNGPGRRNLWRIPVRSYQDFLSGHGV